MDPGAPPGVPGEQDRGPPRQLPADGQQGRGHLHRAGTVGHAQRDLHHRRRVRVRDATVGTEDSFVQPGGPEESAGGDRRGLWQGRRRQLGDA